MLRCWCWSISWGGRAGMGEWNEGNGIIANLDIVGWNHNNGLICSSTGDGREFTSSNMTSLTSPSGEMFEMLQHLVNADRNLLEFVYWGYNLTQYGVIKEVRGGNGLNLAIFDDQETTHTFGSFSDIDQFSCKFQSQFELINQVSPIYSHNIDNQLNVIQTKTAACFFFKKMRFQMLKIRSQYGFYIVQISHMG